MIRYGKNADNPQLKRFTWLIEAFFDETMNEMRGQPPDAIEAWFKELARLMDWIAAGDMNNPPTPKFPEKRALESAKS